jgi:hypothetical protein
MDEGCGLPFIGTSKKAKAHNKKEQWRNAFIHGLKDYSYDTKIA